MVPFFNPIIWLFTQYSCFGFDCQYAYLPDKPNDKNIPWHGLKKSVGPLWQTILGQSMDYSPTTSLLPQNATFYFLWNSPLDLLQQKQYVFEIAHVIPGHHQITGGLFQMVTQPHAFFTKVF